VFLYFYHLWLWGSIAILARLHLLAYVSDPLPESLIFLSALLGTFAGFLPVRASRRRIVFRLVAGCALLTGSAAIVLAATGPSSAFWVCFFREGVTPRLCVCCAFVLLCQSSVSLKHAGTMCERFQSHPLKAMLSSLCGAFTGIFYALVLSHLLEGAAIPAVVLGGHLAIALWGKTSPPPAVARSCSIGAGAGVWFLLGLSLPLLKTYWDRTAPSYLLQHVYVREISLLCALFFMTLGVTRCSSVSREKTLPVVSSQWLVFLLVLAVCQSVCWVRGFAKLSSYLDPWMSKLGTGSLFVLKVVEGVIALGPCSFLLGMLLFRLLDSSRDSRRVPSHSICFLGGSAVGLSMLSCFFVPARILTLAVAALLLAALGLLFVPREGGRSLRRCMSMILVSFFVALVSGVHVPSISLGDRETRLAETMSHFFTLGKTSSGGDLLCRSGEAFSVEEGLFSSMEGAVGSLVAHASRKDLGTPVRFYPQTGAISAAIPLPSVADGVALSADRSFPLSSETGSSLGLIDLHFTFPLSPYDKVYLSEAFYRLASSRLQEKGLLHQRAPSSALESACRTARKVFPYVLCFAVSGEYAHLIAGREPIEVLDTAFERNVMDSAPRASLCEQLGIQTADDLRTILGNDPDWQSPADDGRG